MIINEGIFFGKSKKKDNKPNKPAAPQKKPTATASATLTKEEFNKLISAMEDIAYSICDSVESKYDYTVDADYYGDDISIAQHVQMLKQDFNSGDVVELSIDMVMYPNNDGLSDEDKKKFIKDINSAAKKFGYAIDFAKMNKKVTSSKYPDLFVDAYCDDWSNPYFQIYTKEENYKKSESTNESTSYLDKVVFESANI